MDAVNGLREPFSTHLPPLLAAALHEDLPDITAGAVFGADDRLQAFLVAKAEGILCGAPAFAAAFRFLDASCEADLLHDDGEGVHPGDLLAHVAGGARTVLAAERTALNFVTRLSGIATLTHAFVDALLGTPCKVLDTRKTTPGWRALEKYAVRCGGGLNHRMGLYDVAMLKDTHLAAAGSITAAVEKVYERWGRSVALVVECGTLEQVREALECGVPHIMLDNMEADTMAEAVRLTDHRALTEASGGVTLTNVREIAAAGVDFVSVGALTHSAPALDLSLKVVP
jgi:nicotinate-nucleotide pyrophosphorylase (carboxylating)